MLKKQHKRCRCVTSAVLLSLLEHKLVKGTLAKRLIGKTTGHSCYSYSKEIRQHFLIKMSALVFTSIKHVSMTFFESLLISNENTQLTRTLNAMTHWCLLTGRLATTAN